MSSLWLVLNQATISWSVGSLLNSKRSHSVHSVSPYLAFDAAIGSEKPKNGRARLTNPFLYSSSLVLPSISCKTPFAISGRGNKLGCLALYNSRQTNPVTRAVVVAIAGIILPAICLVAWRSEIGML